MGQARWYPYHRAFYLFLQGDKMAKPVRKKHSQSQKKSFVSPFNIYWEKNNYYLLFAGIGIIIVGFYLMSVGPWNSFTSLVISPIVLVIGYLFVLPGSIFYRSKNSQEDSKEKEVAAGKS